MLSFCINVHMRKTTINVQFRQKMKFLFQNILTFYCLNEKKKDVDKSETSYDHTITVKVLTFNRAHRLRKIPYTKSKFHLFLWWLEEQQNIGLFLSLFSVIAIIKLYGTKKQLFSHANLFFLFLCCIWRQAETGWASKVSPIRDSYTVAFQPDSGLRAIISGRAVYGNVMFWKSFKSKAFVLLNRLFSLKERFHNFSSRRSTAL